MYITINPYIYIRMFMSVRLLCCKPKIILLENSNPFLSVITDCQIFQIR